MEASAGLMSEIGMDAPGHGIAKTGKNVGLNRRKDRNRMRK